MFQLSHQPWATCGYYEGNIVDGLFEFHSQPNVLGKIQWAPICVVRSRRRRVLINLLLPNWRHLRGGYNVESVAGIKCKTRGVRHFVCGPDGSIDDVDNFLKCRQDTICLDPCLIFKSFLDSTFVVLVTPSLLPPLPFLVFGAPCSLVLHPTASPVVESSSSSYGNLPLMC